MVLAYRSLPYGKATHSMWRPVTFSAWLHL